MTEAPNPVPGGVLLTPKPVLEWRLLVANLGAIGHFILVCVFLVYRRKLKRFGGREMKEREGRASQQHERQAGQQLWC